MERKEIIRKIVEGIKDLNHHGICLSIEAFLELLDDSTLKKINSNLQKIFEIREKMIKGE